MYKTDSNEQNKQHFNCGRYTNYLTFEMYVIYICICIHIYYTQFRETRFSQKKKIN